MRPKTLWINVRKRAAQKSAAAAIEKLAVEVSADLLFLQETSKTAKTQMLFPGYEAVTVSTGLSAFVRKGYQPVSIVVNRSEAVAVRAGELLLFNVHFSPYSAATRANQLRWIGEFLASSGRANVVIGGDFNMAPRPCDGTYSEQPSNWTRRGEREAFNELVQEYDLIDLLAQCTQQHFSIERLIGGHWSRFRCDLILCSANLQPIVRASYIHETRLGPWSFSDHSGMAVNFDAQTL